MASELANAAASASFLEFHLYLDPPQQSETLAESLARCHAAREAILSRLQPRLAQHVWEREPFSLRVCSRLAEDGETYEPHLWGRMETADSVHDEWLVVGILIQLSAEQPDVAITVRNSNEGELMLVEAAYCLPQWINPDNSMNRAFLRGGNLHILSQAPDPGDEPRFQHRRRSHHLDGNEQLGLPLAAALRLLRYSEVAQAGETSQPSATAALRRRVRLTCDGPDGCPMRHATSTLLPLLAARLLLSSPELMAAAVAAFEGRSADEMTNAATLKHIFRRSEGLAKVKLRFSRAMYARLVSHRFAAPGSSGLRAAAAEYAVFHGTPASPIVLDLGTKLTFGLEILLQTGIPLRGGLADHMSLGAESADSSATASRLPSTSGDKNSAADDRAAVAEAAARGPRWDRFRAFLAERGYFRGELAGSRLHSELLARAKLAFLETAMGSSDDGFSSGREGSGPWLERMASRAARLVFEAEHELPTEEEVRKTEALGLAIPDDPDDWLSLSESQLQAQLLAATEAADPLDGLANEEEARTGDRTPMASSCVSSAPRSQGNSASKSAPVESDEEASVTALLEDAVHGVRQFMATEAGLEGAEIVRDREAQVQFDPSAFLRSLEAALSGSAPAGSVPAFTRLQSSGQSGDFDESDASFDSEDLKDDWDLSDGALQKEGVAGEESIEDGVASMRQLMEAMDLELSSKAKGPDFVTQVTSNGTGEQTYDGGTKSKSSQSSSEPGGGREDIASSIGPVDLDLNLVQNLLASHSAQGGVAGPASNLLASLGVTLPADADADVGAPAR